MKENSQLSTTQSWYFPTLITLLLLESFFLGVLWTKVQFFEKSGAIRNTTTNETTPTQNNQQAVPTKPTISIATIKTLFNDSNIYVGNKNSKNIFVEVGDPSCPYCHVAGGLNPQLNKQMGPQFTLIQDGGDYVAPVPEMKKLVDQGKAAFIWIYTRGHGNGDMGTKALFCANEQGKFWDVQDKLMTDEGYNLLNKEVKNDPKKSQELASFLSNEFDESTMKTCLDSGKYDKRINDNIVTATNLGVRGTPGFFVNATPFDGAYSWKDMESSVK